MIRGYFNPRTPDRLLPRVSGYVWLPALSGPPENVRRVEFAIDTGAMQTVLMPRDVSRLPGAQSDAFLVALRALPKRTSRGVGGAEEFYETTARVGFQHDDGAFSFIDLPLQLADPQAKISLPSVLGFSALAQMVLHIDGPARRIALDAPVVRLP